MLKRITLLTLLVSILTSNYIFSQAKNEYRLKFAEAESWILFEDYKEALPIYLELIKSNPTNSNLKYRIGQCYLYIPGEKHKAIGFLEEASVNLSPKYREGKITEMGAPYDALYYLANAYRINNQLDKAIETYESFKKNMDTEIYDMEVVDQQIQSCKNAKELMGIPFYVKEKNLGSNINDSYSELNPVISDDESTVIFTKSLAFYDAVMYSTKINGEWSGPVNLNELLKIDVGRDLYPTAISADGKTLYLYGTEDYDGVIFTSDFSNGTWQPPVRLNDNINTKFWESHAVVSHDNKKLFFTSNRKGTLGGLDIYYSNRDSSGNWGPAINLGPPVNSAQNEETPFLTKDDKTLFFSSRGHFNIGGYDIFYSSLFDDGKWSVPLNAGYPLNSTDDDIFFKPVNEGYVGYFAKYDPDGFGDQDIYRIEIFSEENPRKFSVRGIVSVADLINSRDNRVKISALNLLKPDQPVVVYSNPETGEYELELPQGKFEVTYESPGTEITKRNIDLALNHPSDSLVIPGTILPKADFKADLTLHSDRSITGIEGDTLRIPVEAEPGSILTVEYWSGDSLVKTERLTVGDSVINYKVSPLKGDNRIAFTVTDKFNNTTTGDVLITVEQKITAQPVIRPEYENVISRKQIEAITGIQKNSVDVPLDAGDLLQSQFNESVKKGISRSQIADMMTSLSSLPGTTADQFLKELAEVSEGPLLSWLNSLDLKKERIKTPTELIAFILEKIEKEELSQETFFKALAGVIASKNIPADSIKSQAAVPQETHLWYLWLLLGGGLIIIFIFYLRKKKDKKE